jgi:Uma2 family endonuclease
MAPPGGRHAKIQSRLARTLLNFIDPDGSDPTGVGEIYTEGRFLIAENPDTVLVPDIAFVRSERLVPEVEEIGLLRQVPDLAIEIVSPSDRPGRVLEKAMIYLDAGVPLVWTIDPKQQRVMVWDADRLVRTYGIGDTMDGGDVLPGFQLPVTAQLFGSRASTAT